MGFENYITSAEFRAGKGHSEGCFSSELGIAHLRELRLGAGIRLANGAWKYERVFVNLSAMCVASG